MYRLRLYGMLPVLLLTVGVAAAQPVSVSKPRLHPVATPSASAPVAATKKPERPLSATERERIACLEQCEAKTQKALPTSTLQQCAADGVTCPPGVFSTLQHVGRKRKTCRDVCNRG